MPRFLTGARFFMLNTRFSAEMLAEKVEKPLFCA